MTNRVAIIITTYDGSKWIKQCLSSVFRSVHENCDVFVVDNHSSDDTVDMVRTHFPQTEVIPLSENRGFCGGNNVGMRHAVESGYDMIALLNQDTVVTEGWLGALIDAAGGKDVGAAQSLLLLADDPSRVNTSGNILHYLGFGHIGGYREFTSEYDNGPVRDIGYASGAAVLYKSSMLKKIGLFDESYFSYHEDLDLSWRARIAGYRVVVAPASRVLHHYSFRRNKNLLYWSERNRLITLCKNYQLRTLIVLAPVCLSIELAMIIYSIVAGFFHKKLWSYVYVILRMPSIMASRRHIRSFRATNDKDIVRTMAARLEFDEMRTPFAFGIMNYFLSVYYRAALWLVA